MADLGDLRDLASALLLLALLLGAVALAHLILPRLPEHHRARDSLATVRVVSGIAITFASLVLGLLTASVNTAFSTAENDVNALAGAVLQADGCLRSYGPEAGPIRAALRAYAAGAVFATWPEEPAPPGAYPRELRAAGTFESPALGDLLDRVRVAAAGLENGDAARRPVAALCAEDVARLVASRWKLIGEAHSTVTVPFYRLLVLMLLAIFVTLGLDTPRTPLALTAVALGAATLAGAVFVVLELDDPLDGLVKVGSASMRGALAELDARRAGPGP